MHGGIVRLQVYLGAPELDGPVEGRGDKQVGEIHWACRCVAVESCDWPVVALKHLTDARFAAMLTPTAQKRTHTHTHKHTHIQL